MTMPVPYPALTENSSEREHLRMYRALLDEANGVRAQRPRSYWQTQTTWYIDPAGEHGASPGADGLTPETPIGSMSDWRDRNRGAEFRAPVLIRALSGSTNDDDGNISGFETPSDSTIYVAVVGEATPVTDGTGTVIASTARSGNGKQTIVDTAQSWAANGLVTSTAGTRMIRKVGGAWHAFVAQAVSGTQVMLTRPTSASETPVGTIGNTQVNPAVGDAYEVCSLTPWPQLRNKPGGVVRGYMLDYTATTAPTVGTGRTQAFERQVHILCGWRTTFTGTIAGGNVSVNTCMFNGQVSVNGPFGPSSCGFLNLVEVQLSARDNWNSTENLFIGPSGRLRVAHGGSLAATGTIVAHDLGANVPVFVDFLGQCTFVGGGLVGDGMTGKLVDSNGGTVQMASLVTATTTDANPFRLNGSSSATPPGADTTIGGGIFT